MANHGNPSSKKKEGSVLTLSYISRKQRFRSPESMATPLTSRAAMIRRPLTILVLLTGLNLLNYVDRLVLSAVLPSVQTSLGVSNTVAGWFATVFLVGYFATAPIFG